MCMEDHELADLRFTAFEIRSPGRWSLQEEMRNVAMP
jgi:hypothetical protein